MRGPFNRTEAPPHKRYSQDEAHFQGMGRSKLPVAALLHAADESSLLGSEAAKIRG